MREPMQKNNLMIYLREKTGCTQNAIAMKTGLTRSAISALETGKNEPSRDTLMRLSKIYNFPDGVFSNTNQKPSKDAEFFFARFGVIDKLSIEDQEMLLDWIKNAPPIINQTGSFIEHNAGGTHHYYLNAIKVAFHKQDNSHHQACMLTIFIGKGVCEQMELKRGDRLTFHVDSIANRIWLFKKEKLKGYILQERKLKSGKPCDYLHLTVQWHELPPADSERYIRLVKHEITEQGLKVYANV